MTLLYKLLPLCAKEEYSCTTDVWKIITYGIANASLSYHQDLFHILTMMHVQMMDSMRNQKYALLSSDASDCGFESFCSIVVLM